MCVFIVQVSADREGEKPNKKQIQAGMNTYTSQDLSLLLFINILMSVSDGKKRLMKVYWVTDSLNEQSFNNIAKNMHTVLAVGEIYHL